LEDRGVLIRWAATPSLDMPGCGSTVVLLGVMMSRVTFLILVCLAIRRLMSPLSLRRLETEDGSVVEMAVPGVRLYGTNTTLETGSCRGELSMS
jgi:hypothetical protein